MPAPGRPRSLVSHPAVSPAYADELLPPHPPGTLLSRRVVEARAVVPLGVDPAHCRPPSAAPSCRQPDTTRHSYRRPRRPPDRRYQLEIGVQESSVRLRPLPPGPRLTHATGCYPIIKLAPPAATERPSASWSGNLRRRLRRSESVGPAHRLYFSFTALKCHTQPSSLHEPAPERRFQLEIRVACAPAGTSPGGRSDSGMTLVKRRGASGPQNQS